MSLRDFIIKFTGLKIDDKNTSLCPFSDCNNHFEGAIDAEKSFKVFTFQSDKREGYICNSCGHEGDSIIEYLMQLYGWPEKTAVKVFAEFVGCLPDPFKRQLSFSEYDNTAKSLGFDVLGGLKSEELIVLNVLKQSKTWLSVLDLMNKCNNMNIELIMRKLKQKGKVVMRKQFCTKTFRTVNYYKEFSNAYKS